MLVSNALQGVLTLLVCIALGVYMAKRGYLTEDMEARLSVLTLRFSVPCLLFLNCQSYLSLDLLRSMGWTLLIPLLTILGGWLLGMLIARFFHIRQENRGLFLVMFSLSNTIFIGLPVCMAIFGEDALPLIATYFPCNTLVFWTLGAMSLARDGGAPFTFGLKTLRQVFSPPLVGALLGALFALTGITTPGFITEALRHVGNLTTPVTLFVTGAILTRMGREALKLSKEGVLTLFGRLLLLPSLCIALSLLMGAAPLTTQVYTVETAMPVMSQSMLVARTYGANHKLAAQMITITTLVGLLYVPLLMLILSKLS